MKGHVSHMNELCQGCAVNGCLIQYNPKLIEKCPCCICLVKMICQKMCRERIIIYENLKALEKDSLSLIAMDDMEG